MVENSMDCPNASGIGPVNELLFRYLKNETR